MARKMQKLLSMVLALSMCISLLSITALAEGEGESSAPPVAGTAENPAVTGPTVIGADTSDPDNKQPSVTVDENGNTITEKWTETTWSGKTETDDVETSDGTKPGTTTTVKGEETTKDTTITDQNGNLISQTGEVKGEETTETTPSASDTPETPDITGNVDSKPGESIKVDLTPGQGSAENPVQGSTGRYDMWLENTVLPKWVQTATSDTSESTTNPDGTVASVTNVTVKNNENGTKTFTRTETKSDGSKSVETVVVTYDEDNNVIGYDTTTETTTVTDETKKPETPGEATVGTETEGSNTEYSFVPPTLPSVTTPVTEDETGKLNGEAVLPLTDGSGIVIGYVKVTYTNNEAKYDDPVLGTYYATTTKTETLANGLKKTTTTKTKVTDTSTINSGVTVKDGTWSVTGWMGEVNEGENNGDITLISPQPDTDLLTKSESWKKTDETAENDHLGQLHDPAKSTFDKENLEPGKLLYDGYGLYSNIFLSYWKKTDAGKWTYGQSTYVHQFKLVDSEGHTFYAYCADWTTTAYVDSKYTMENVLDADYINDATDRKHLQVIAQNGYWGTKNEAGEGETPTQGSLAAVKKLMDDKNLTLTVNDETKNASEYIDDGIALAVTQAAIWRYGNQEAELIFGGNEKGPNGAANMDNYTEQLLEYWATEKRSSYDSTNWTEVVRNLSQEQREAAVKLYKALCDLPIDDVDKNVTDIITKDDIKGASITVIEKVESLEDVGAAVAAATNNTYKTNLSFTLAVVPSKINSDDLVVYVYQGDSETPVDSIRLTDATSGNTVGNHNYTLTTNDKGEAVYTINGLELQEGVNINLTLQGTQKLQGGAYLFTSSGADAAGTHTKSQTFVGLVSEDSTRQVDLNVNLKFNVTDPAYTVETGSSSFDRTQVEWEASYSTYRIPSGGPSSGDDDDDDDDDDVIVRGDDDDDDDDDVIVRGDDDDDDSIDISGETPTTNIPSDIPAIDIPSDIPATNVPKTGDISVLWYALSACSGLGLAGTALLGRKRRDDED